MVYLRSYYTEIGRESSVSIYKETDRIRFSEISGAHLSPVRPEVTALCWRGSGEAEIPAIPITNRGIEKKTEAALYSPGQDQSDQDKNVTGHIQHKLLLPLCRKMPTVNG